ncbi:MAG: 30S ribosomal protein S6 [Patescibacteria group bacterium]
MQDTDLRKYELMVIISGEMTDTEFEKQLGELRRMLQEDTAGIAYEDNWGKRDMTYRIKKQWRGFYVVFNFNAAPPSILEVRTSLKLNPVVLRHLLITVPEDYEPGRYKDQVLREEPVEEERKFDKQKQALPRRDSEVKKVVVEEAPVATTTAKPTLPTRKEEEEQLKTVEKKLEKILENPDIDIR